MRLDFYLKETKKSMKSLGTYKKEFDRMIRIYAGLLYQYDMLEQEFIDSGCQTETESSVGTMKKSATYSSMEKLRTDIATYSDKLGLNPKSYDAIDIKQERISKLDLFLKEVSKESSRHNDS